MLEVDRVLRPGGFWVLSGPPINYEKYWKGWETTVEKEKALQDKIMDFATKMCWKLYAKKDDLAVWQKPMDNSCYEEREEETYPPICDDAIEPDAAWYVPMRPCVVPQPKGLENIAVGKIAKWPERLTAPSDRLKLLNKRTYAFKEDTKLWQERISHYKNLWADLRSNQIRNVMDMYTEFGGFGAALANSDVWTMNVVSSYAANTLGVVYDRGLIGAVHDWYRALSLSLSLPILLSRSFVYENDRILTFFMFCFCRCEAFSTYPRTYDWLHVSGLFTAEGHRFVFQHSFLSCVLVASILIVGLRHHGF